MKKAKRRIMARRGKKMTTMKKATMKKATMKKATMKKAKRRMMARKGKKMRTITTRERDSLTSSNLQRGRTVRKTPPTSSTRQAAG